MLEGVGAAAGWLLVTALGEAAGCWCSGGGGGGGGGPPSIGLPIAGVSLQVKKS